MACFLVGAAEAVVVTVAANIVHKNEIKKEAEMAAHPTAAEAIEEQNRIPWSRKLRWLSWLLWGGVLLLAYEHVWHGEVVPWFPFLTAMSNPGDASEMFHEMATIGVTMCAIVTVAWAIICAVADAIVKRMHRASAAA